VINPITRQVNDLLDISEFGWMPELLRKCLTELAQFLFACGAAGGLPQMATDKISRY